jgi:hypothetical protein
MEREGKDVLMQDSCNVICHMWFVDSIHVPCEDSAPTDVSMKFAVLPGWYHVIASVNRICNSQSRRSRIKS